MKQRIISQFILIFIAIYMLLALGWWTYSLINYNKSYSDLQKKELDLMADRMALSLNNILLSYDQSNIKGGLNTDSLIKVRFRRKEYRITQKNLYEITKFISLNKNINYDTKVINNDIEISLNINPEKLIEISNKEESKRFAWYGEGISIGALTLLIVGILGYYLDKIIRFNQQQNNFLLAITHELKTPVASASLAIHSAIKFGENREKVTHVLGIAQNNMKRLSSLIEQVVMATKFENNFIVCHKEWVSLEKIFENIFIDFGENLPDNLKNSSFNYRNISLYCDIEMIQIALSNLISNAIKYSDQNCVNINVKVHSLGNLQAITICDTGIGIPEKERKSVFQKFYRSGDEKTRIAKGSGLGLFLVKKIAELHQAKVSIAPNTPKGTCISILFNNQDIRME